MDDSDRLRLKGLAIAKQIDKRSRKLREYVQACREQGVSDDLIADDLEQASYAVRAGLGVDSFVYDFVARLDDVDDPLEKQRRRQLIADALGVSRDDLRKNLLRLAHDQRDTQDAKIDALEPQVAHGLAAANYVSCHLTTQQKWQLAIETMKRVIADEADEGRQASTTE